MLSVSAPRDRGLAPISDTYIDIDEALARATARGEEGELI